MSAIRPRTAARAPVATRVAAWLTLIRWRSCVSAMLLFGIGLASNPRAVEFGAAAALIGLGLAVAQADVLNDLADRDLDLVDKPERPLPSGTLSVRAVWRLCAVLTVLPPAVGFAGGLAIGIWVTALVAGSFAYCLLLKSTVLIGNLLVAAMVSSSLLMGYATVGQTSRAHTGEAVMILLFMASYELAKTAADVEGDAIAGLSTVATRFGSGVAVRCSAAFFVAMSIVAAAQARSPQGAGFLAVFVLTVAIPVLRRLWHLVQLTSPPTDEVAGLLRVMQHRWKYGLGCLVILV
jgi:geranylgeranylglycerol-phosphate geranylgeranyltransferase